MGKINNPNILISSTDFVDFINKSGTSKITKVKEINQRGDYTAAFDFYLQFRQKVINHLKLGKDEFHYESFIASLNPKKQERYRFLCNKYIKFLKQKKYQWLEPKTKLWTYKELNIKVNPELGLLINNEKYLIKLFIRKSSLKVSEAKSALILMEDCFSKDIYGDYKCAILDLNTGSLHTLKDRDNRLELSVLLSSEAESFLNIHFSLQSIAA